MNWKHGYFADAGYTHGYYAETMPLRLRWAALLQGHAAPETGFRYLDAGCGQGLNLVLAAAAHPESEFVGIDFMPEHIAHATALAARCGLKNVRFVEGDFVALAADPSDLGTFDYAVCHGITTWIAPAVRTALLRMVGQCLKPAGLFYNSYNTQPGWLWAVPFQHLVLLEQRHNAGTQALAAAQASMAQLQKLNAGLFVNQPSLAGRLEGMKQQDPAYLVQEYNNQSWQPLFVSQMMDEMAAVKLGYLGTATLPEAFDNILPAPVREWLAQQPNALMKEQLRDYVLGQSFRRDLYVKGQNKPWPKVHEQQLRAVRFVANPAQPRPEAGQPWTIKGGIVEISGEAPIYTALINLLDAAGDNGTTVGALIDAVPSAANKASVMQVLAMLTHANWVMPVHTNLPSRRPEARAVNTALLQDALNGAPYRFVALPGAGCAIGVTTTDWLLLALDLANKPTATLVPELSALLVQLGRGLFKEGQPITDEAQRQEMLATMVQSHEVGKRVLFKRLGAL